MLLEQRYIITQQAEREPGTVELKCRISVQSHITNECHDPLSRALEPLELVSFLRKSVRTCQALNVYVLGKQIEKLYTYEDRHVLFRILRS